MKIANYIWPVGGGSLGSVIGSISFHILWEVLLFAFLGALIGWFTKLGLDYLKKKINKSAK